MKLALFTSNKEKAEHIKERIYLYGLNLGYEFDDESPDVVISIGGDGTFLRSVHRYINQLDAINFIAINAGSLGFYTSLGEDDIDLLFRTIEQKEELKQPYRLLKADLVYEDGVENIFALNEIRIESPFKTLVSKVLIDSIPLENYRGNGLLVCSELGSSAYNKSLGGAIIGGKLDLLELTEIASIQNKVYRSLSSSLILSGDTCITFSGDFENVIVGYDHLTFQKEHLTSISIKKSNKIVTLIQPKTHHFINTLKRSFIL